MLISIILTSLAINLSLILTPTPLSLGIWLLTISIIIMITMTFFMSSWFRFITFLIYIGGILVIFAYFIALQPNQPLFLHYPIVFLFISIILFSSLPLYQTNISILSSTSTSILYLLIKSNIIIFWAIAVLLFIALIIVVKLAKIKEGPLRPFNVYV